MEEGIIELPAELWEQRSPGEFVLRERSSELQERVEEAMKPIAMVEDMGLPVELQDSPLILGTGSDARQIGMIRNCRQVGDAIVGDADITDPAIREMILNPRPVSILTPDESFGEKPNIFGQDTDEPIITEARDELR